jgi:hypothetical protein
MDYDKNREYGPCFVTCRHDTSESEVDKLVLYLLLLSCLRGNSESTDCFLGLFNDTVSSAGTTEHQNR